MHHMNTLQLDPLVKKVRSLVKAHFPHAYRKYLCPPRPRHTQLEFRF